MTAEIIAMNRGAAAIAADTMISSDDDDEFRAFGRHEKIFPISGQRLGERPVAAVVYGSSELLGTPWVSLISELRSNVDVSRYFTSIGDLGSWFFSEFLPNVNHLRRAEVELAEESVDLVATKLQAKTQGALGSSEGIQDDQAIRALARDQLESLTSSEDRDAAAPLAAYYAGRVYDSVKQKFRYDERVDLANEDTMELVNRSIAVEVRRRQGGLDNTGIAFVGYLGESMVPSIETYAVSGFELGKPLSRRRDEKCTTAGSHTPATIVPLAQGDMAMEALFEGMPGSMQEDVRNLLIGMAEVLSRQVNGLLKSRGIMDDVVAEMVGNIFDATARNHWRIVEAKMRATGAPLTRTLQILPKAELAAVAENLVAFAALGSRLRPYGTVGGPIDVAVVSSEDGFKWVRRSPYAPEHLNR